MPNLLLRAAGAGGPAEATGRVFHDRDGDGLFGTGDEPLAEIAVTNGVEITLTDRKGRWALPLRPGATDFHVIPPAAWQPPVHRDGRRRFHFIHQPQGTPGLPVGGLAPTGPLPASIDFPLIPQDPSARFAVAICGDPQPRNLREVGYLGRTAPAAVADADVAFAVALGDISFDRIDLFPAISDTLGVSAVPWTYVIGNHDLDFGARGRVDSRASYRSHFGPTCHAFNRGKVHFLVLDNIEWLGWPEGETAGTGFYRGELDDAQLEFVRNDLALVPDDHLVVVLMHIPLFNPAATNERGQTVNRAALYRLLETRRHAISFSAHTHTLQHVRIDAAEGWQGSQPHHHVIAGALCGSWFGGAPGIDGVPHAMMSDGTPRGFFRATFDGNSCRIGDYRLLEATPQRMFHLSMPDFLDAGDPTPAGVTVNVYNAGFDASVDMRLAGSDRWQALERSADPDPVVLALRERDAGLTPPYRPLGGSGLGGHLWAGRLPAGLPGGSHRIEFRIRDGHGGEATTLRPLRIRV